ncbi:hypothetical protein D9M68_925450 [compost metagenome]
MIITVIESAEPSGQFRPWPNCSSIRLENIMFLPPPRTLGETKAPIAGMKTRIEPAMMPGLASGRMILRNTRQRVA